MQKNIARMFESATVKLTAWYVLGIMIISLIFSVLVYNFATGEITAVIETRRTNDRILANNGVDVTQLRQQQLEQARHNIIAMLTYANIAVLCVATIAGYLWSRRILGPIEQAHEAQSRFTSDASHELKTPLAVMKTEIEVILADPKAKKSDYREILESNLEEVDRLSDLSATLLKLAKLEYSALEWRKFNITETVDIAMHSLGERGERIDVLAMKKLPEIEANPASITELVFVLLDNALKYSPSGSRVKLAFRRRTRAVEVSVTNAGPGIEPERLPHIFSRFYRADTARNHQSDASYGLGLPLAKKIVELHHGELTATSQPGVFTTFTVKLPLSQT